MLESKQSKGKPVGEGVLPRRHGQAQGAKIDYGCPQDRCGRALAGAALGLGCLIDDAHVLVLETHTNETTLGLQALY